MPVLFGNTYILPAIIVVVVLVLLLLVLMLRKRGSSPSTSKTAAKPERRVASPPKPTKVDRPAVAERSVTGPEVTEPSAEAAKVAPRGAATSRAAHVETAPQADPLHAVILDILRGWGDIVDDDIKRLALFRPEKVLAAVQAMELPKELKSNQHAHTRLTQLRQYATNRVDLAREQQAAESAAAPAEVAPEPPVVPVIPVVLPEPLVEPQTALPENDYPDELSTWPEAEIEAEPPVYPPFAVPVESSFEAPAEAPAEILLEAPIEAPAEVSLEPFRESTWLQPDTETTPKWQTDDTPMFLDEPEDSLASLLGTIKTVDELLALPAEERPDLVTFLEPAELSKVFDRTDDPGLKKAVIDTLEHVSNPASLEILRRCLDDPDPQIQLYALEAADRLLGVD